MDGFRVKRYWVSWVNVGENDYRPITYPPNRGILGWWVSGEDTEGCTILVACVQGEDIDSAKEAVYKDWPELRGTEDSFRFFEERDSDYDPSKGGRFPLSDWMKERI